MNIVNLSDSETGRNTYDKEVKYPWGKPIFHSIDPQSKSNQPKHESDKMSHKDP